MELDTAHRTAYNCKVPTVLQHVLLFSELFELPGWHRFPRTEILSPPLCHSAITDHCRQIPRRGLVGLAHTAAAAE